MQSIQGILAGLQQQAAADTVMNQRKDKASAVANALAHPASGVFAAAAAGSHPAAIASASAPSSSGPTSGQANGAGSTITANDFLTLLVAEMKNQDPTAPTDPNAYISQLVQVNSLQQLISINQGIGSLGTSSSGGSTTGTSGVGSAGTGSPGSGATAALQPVGG